MSPPWKSQLLLLSWPHKNGNDFGTVPQERSYKLSGQPCHQWSHICVICVWSTVLTISWNTTHQCIHSTVRLIKLNQSELEFGAKRRHKKKQTNKQTNKPWVAINRKHSICRYEVVINDHRRCKLHTLLGPKWFGPKRAVLIFRQTFNVNKSLGRLRPGNVHMWFSSLSGYRAFITPPPALWN